MEIGVFMSNDDDNLSSEDINRLARSFYSFQIEDERAAAIAGELGNLRATLKGEVGQLSYDVDPFNFASVLQDLKKGTR